MKAIDIANNNGWDVKIFVPWLLSSGLHYNKTVTGTIEVIDRNVEDTVNAFSAYLTALEHHALSEQDRLAEEANQKKMKQAALASMLITSGFSFDGYTITKYSGYISGDHAVEVARPTQGFWGSVKGSVGGDLLDGLVRIRRFALAELKEKAHELGCNAVIGVDFDYITLDPESVNNRGATLYLPFLFAVTANGNAVVIEKSG